MIGFDAIGFHAVGEMLIGFPALLYFEPVSRISSGGTLRPPAQVPTVLEGLNWNDGTPVKWNDGSQVFWNS